MILGLWFWPELWPQIMTFGLIAVASIVGVAVLMRVGTHGAASPPPAPTAPTSGNAEQEPPPPTVTEIVSEPARRRAPRRVHKDATLTRQLTIDGDRHIDLGDKTGYPIGIVGESYRQSALRDLSAGRRRRGQEVDFVVALIPEPTNPVDPNAIRVDILDGAQVGYLSRDDAAAYRLALAAVATTGKQGVCRAKLIGGVTGKPSIGVVIDLIDPHELLARLGQPF